MKFKSISTLSNKKINFLDINRKNLKKFFLSLDEKPFHADQIMKWIYHYYCDDFDQMTDINKSLRSKLNLFAEIRAPEFVDVQYSFDGTIKWNVKVGNNQYIETVYIPEKNRTTLCISSQVGCALKCAFCATAQQGFNRNLQVSEIIGQLWRVGKIINNVNKIKKKYQNPVTNVVMMGMGEPLLNLNNVIPAIEIMLDPFGFNLSKRHITISTVGIVPALDILSNKLDIALAISLHAPNNIIRDSIIPINKKYNIQSLLSVVHRYLNKSNANHGKITVEYVMLNNINDDTEHAHQLAKSLKKIPCKINLIPWNFFPNSTYKCSSFNRIHRFFNILIKYGFTTIIRKNRGNDINAACGQLVGKVINRIRPIDRIG